jgi:hypothetical protein
MHAHVGRLLYGYRGIANANQYSHAIPHQLSNAIGHTVRLANTARHRHAHRGTNTNSDQNSWTLKMEYPGFDEGCRQNQDTLPGYLTTSSTK